MRTAGIVMAVLSAPGLLIGIIWIAVFYVSQATFPIAAIGQWNLIIGALFFISGVAFLIVGVVLLVVAKSRASKPIGHVLGTKQ